MHASTQISMNFIRLVAETGIDVIVSCCYCISYNHRAFLCSQHSQIDGINNKSVWRHPLALGLGNSKLLYLPGEF